MYLRTLPTYAAAGRFSDAPRRADGVETQRDGEPDVSALHIYTGPPDSYLAIYLSIYLSHIYPPTYVDIISIGSDKPATRTVLLT